MDLRPSITVAECPLQVQPYVQITLETPDEAESQRLTPEEAESQAQGLSLDEVRRGLQEHGEAIKRVDGALATLKSQLVNMREQDLHLLKQLIHVGDTIRKMGRSHHSRSNKRSSHKTSKDLMNSAVDLSVTLRRFRGRSSSTFSGDYSTVPLVRRQSEPPQQCFLSPGHDVSGDARSWSSGRRGSGSSMEWWSEDTLGSSEDGLDTLGSDDDLYVSFNKLPANARITSRNDLSTNTLTNTTNKHTTTTITTTDTTNTTYTTVVTNPGMEITITKCANTEKAPTIVTHGIYTEEKAATIISQSINTQGKSATVTKHSINMEEKATTIISQSFNTEQTSAIVAKHSINTEEKSATIAKNCTNDAEKSATVAKPSINAEDKSTTIDKHIINMEEKSTTIAKHCTNDAENSATIAKHSITTEEKSATVARQSIITKEKAATVAKNSITMEEKSATVAIHSITTKEKAATVAKNSITTEEKSATVAKHSTDKATTISPSTPLDLLPLEKFHRPKSHSIVAASLPSRPKPSGGNSLYSDILNKNVTLWKERLEHAQSVRQKVSVLEEEAKAAESVS